MVVTSEQSCALGAVMFAATAAGLYDNGQEAQKKMNSGFSNIYYPEPKNAGKYENLYELYKFLGRDLGDYLRRF